MSLRGRRLVSNGRSWYRRWGFVGALLIVALPLQWGAAVAAEGPDFSSIDRYVEKEVARDNVPGLALAVVKGDRLQHFRGFGGVDGAGDRPTLTTSFVLGSMSKSITAVAVMQLAEQGKLELDAPVQRYLPWFRVDSAEASSRITVRHLLNHTSGIPGKAPRAPGDDPSIQDHARALRDVELVHSPGGPYEYSSPNYQVLGAVVEEVSGMKFGEYLARHIFRPLEMEHTYVSAASAGDGLARGHRYVLGRPVAGGIPYDSGRLPSASLISSAGDMSRYLVAHLNDGRFGQTSILSPAGMAELHRPAVEAESGSSYAMGWRVGEIRGVPAVHHGGDLPGYRSKMVLLPKDRWGVVVLTNAETPIERLYRRQATSHRIADGVAAMLTGGSPGQGVSLEAVYLIVALGLGLAVFSTAREAAQFAGWRTDLLRERSSGTSSRVRVIGGAVTHLAWPVILLIGVPKLARIPWSEIILSMPDVGYVLVAAWSVAAVIALAKLVVTLRVWRVSRPNDEAKLGQKQPSG
jgi:CubicO group peptidase (beta-lactamase class C family)